MVSAIDETVANVSSALKECGMWKDSLLIFASDNGSPVASSWGTGGTNAPLRGGKDSNWEGGVRTPAFINGGWLPAHRRGVQLTGLIHICDFYATLCSLAAAGLGTATCVNSSGPAPIDSVDMSDWWLEDSAVASPRQEIVHDLHTFHKGNTSMLLGGVLRVGDWKLIAHKERQASWFGDFSPQPSLNVTLMQRRADEAFAYLRSQWRSHTIGRAWYMRQRNALSQESTQLRQLEKAGMLEQLKKTACAASDPCLFDIARDPQERHNLALAFPKRVEQLYGRLRQLFHGFHLLRNPSVLNKTAFCTAAKAARGFLSPWTVPNELPKQQHFHLNHLEPLSFRR